MSLLTFSCSRQEVEAALAYFSFNASTLPLSVYQFYQNLQNQILSDGIQHTDPTRTTLLPRIQQTSSPQTSHNPQVHACTFPTPSPSPPRSLGPQFFREEVSRSTHPSLSPTHSAFGIQPEDGVILGDADQSSCPLQSVFPGNSIVQLKDGISDRIGQSTLGGPPGSTVQSGGGAEENSLAGQADRNTNSKRKWTNSSEGKEGEDAVVRSKKGSRGDKSRGDKSKNSGGKSKNAGGSSGGGGGGGGGRRSGCPRNGANIQRKTRSQVAASVDSDEGSGDRMGLDEGLGSGLGDESGKFDRSFIYSPIRASPSKAVLEESSLLLLHLYHSSESLDWVEGFTSALKGESWVESDALATESLKNLALRCARSQSISLVGTFCKMLNELMFAAKVNSIFHAQKLARPSKMPSLEGILRSLQQEGFGGRELGIWLSSGSRWARIASAASKRLTYRMGREVSSTVLVEVCNQIRAPSGENLSLVRDGIIPAVLELQKAISFSIPVLFSARLQSVYQLPPTLDIAQLEATDWFFDLFYQRMAQNVPRDPQLWKRALEFRPWNRQTLNFHKINQKFLNSFTAEGKQIVTAWEDEEGPLSDDEMEEAIAEQLSPSGVAVPLTRIIAFAGDIHLINSDVWGPLLVVKSSFRNRKVLPEEKGFPYKTTDRNSWTENQRKMVAKGERPDTLEKFSEKIQTRYEPATGSLAANQKWLILTQKAIRGREVKVLDAEEKTVFTVDATLTEEQRKCLLNAVEALCLATGVQIRDLNTSRLPIERLFQVWHLSYYARYGQSGKEIPEDFHPLHVGRSDGSKVNHCQFFVRASKDLQVFGREFAALSEAIGPVLQKIVEKRLERDKDIFGEEVEAIVDIMPLQDFTPVRPFTGLRLIKTAGMLEGVSSSA
ncbi:hypothetical protein EV361DRAFT_870937 [Lentinula raphanica]|nr:hypothetical protein EV361DRAFT_870937 [Lentinula raphanica]